ncbi:hypothetical protein [Streptomyces sp. NPDC047981]|uniref:hypothetical protein n=1 Tax=Streptomyces sp. NPDC047981 TaxID=3154610 RepID=UPI003448BDE2
MAGTSWATHECRCGHPRFRHGEPAFSGACGTCDDCRRFSTAPAAHQETCACGWCSYQGLSEREVRKPHPSCPNQDPDCIGIHHLDG